MPSAQLSSAQPGDPVDQERREADEMLRVSWGSISGNASHATPGFF